MIDEKDVIRVTTALEDGELFECSGQVIYGWRVGIDDDPTFEASGLILLLWEEMKRLRGLLAR